MAVSPPAKRKSERLNRRKLTLINKAHELAELCEVDVALIVRSRKSGQYFTYYSLDLESWPPSKEQVLSHRLWLWRSERGAINGDVATIVPDTSELAPT